MKRGLRIAWAMMLAVSLLLAALPANTVYAENESGTNPSGAQGGGYDEEGFEIRNETVEAFDMVSVRAQATTGAERIGTLAEGERVKRIGYTDNWSKIEFNGGIAYCMSEWLILVAEEDEIPVTDDGDEKEAAETQLPLQAGDFIEMGHFEQDGDPFNGTEPITWRVLAVDNGLALVISEYCLESRNYHYEAQTVSWEECSLREYLNGDFYDYAFSEDEKAKIATTRLNNDDNSVIGEMGWEDTEDRVFVLSITEAEEYFASDEDRCAVPTELARSNGINYYDTYGTSWWWLRSPGFGYGGASVFDDGSIPLNAMHLNPANGGVRPAMWIYLNTDSKSNNENTQGENEGGGKPVITQEGTHDYDFDLNMSHYVSPIAFANAVLAQAEEYGNTLTALGLLQDAYEVWANPRFMAAKETLLRSQWKTAAIYRYNSSEERYSYYTIYEYNGFGDLVRKLDYSNSFSMSTDSKTRPDGIVLEDYFVSSITQYEYDDNHHVVCEKYMEAWLYNDASLDDGYYLTLPEMEEILETWQFPEGYDCQVGDIYEYEYDESGHIRKEHRISARAGIQSENTYEYEYDDNGQIWKEYKIEAGEPVLVAYWEYDKDGSLIIETCKYSDGTISSKTNYYYDEYGQNTGVKTFYSDSNLTWEEENLYDDSGFMTYTTNIVYEGITLGMENSKSWGYCEYNEYGDVVETFDSNLVMNPWYYEYEYNEYGLKTERQRLAHQSVTVEAYEYNYFPLKAME